MRKRSNYKPKPIKAPGIRLATKDVESLALRTHLAAVMLDTESGLDQFTKIICKCSVAMDYCGTIDRHARAILGTATKQLDAIIKRKSISDDEHAYLKRVAGFINDWLAEGRITYAGLMYAKNLMHADELIAKTRDCAK